MATTPVTYDVATGQIVAGAGSQGTIAAAAQSLTASSDNVLTGTLFQLPNNGLRVGSKIKFRFAVTKTAAGLATWSAKVKFGTAGTNADAAIATFTSGTNTAVADQGNYEILVEVTALGATATVKGNLCGNNAYGTATTGLGSMPLFPTSTATFNAGAAAPFLHLDINPGVLAVMTGVGWVEVVA